MVKLSLLFAITLCTKYYKNKNHLLFIKAKLREEIKLFRMSIKHLPLTLSNQHHLGGYILKMKNNSKFQEALETYIYFNVTNH